MITELLTAVKRKTVRTSEPLAPPAPSAGLCWAGKAVGGSTGPDWGSARPPPASHSAGSPWQQHPENPEEAQWVNSQAAAQGGATHDSIVYYRNTWLSPRKLSSTPRLCTHTHTLPCQHFVRRANTHIHLEGSGETVSLTFTASDVMISVWSIISHISVLKPTKGDSSALRKTL